MFDRWFLTKNIFPNTQFGAGIFNYLRTSIPFQKLPSVGRVKHMEHLLMKNHHLRNPSVFCFFHHIGTENLLSISSTCGVISWFVRFMTWMVDGGVVCSPNNLDCMDGVVYGLYVLFGVLYAWLPSLYGCNLVLYWLYHLERTWGNSHVILVYHSPLLLATFWEWLDIYFHCGKYLGPNKICQLTVIHHLKKRKHHAPPFPITSCKWRFRSGCPSIYESFMSSWW